MHRSGSSPAALRIAVMGVFVACGGCAQFGDPQHQESLVPTPSPGQTGSDPDLGMTPSDVTPDSIPDGAAPQTPDLASGAGAAVQVGMPARTSGDLNLRSGAGTTNAIVVVMSCGTRVDVLGGPQSGWWNLRDGANTGWASGKYLVAESAWSAAMCAGLSDGGAPVGAADGGQMAQMPAEVTDIFARAKLGVGYSYDWGHGSWGADGKNIGSCLGNCPNCTHGGAYGADCSGFVAKCWQVPGASPITTDLHPYSTNNFYNATTHWSVHPRTDIHPADALVYNANGAGHIMLFESGADPWGNLWVYEARGCATGIVHDLHAVSASYITIRREGL